MVIDMFILRDKYDNDSKLMSLTQLSNYNEDTRAAKFTKLSDLFRYFNNLGFKVVSGGIVDTEGFL